MVKWVFSFLTLVESHWAFALVPLLLSPVITSNEKRKGLLIWKKRRNISCRHAVHAFPASEPCSCSQLDLTWFLFDIQGCTGFAEWGWVSQVITAKWEIHTSPRSNADLDRIQGAQSDPIWAPAPASDSQVRVSFDSAKAVWFAVISCILNMSVLRASAVHSCGPLIAHSSCMQHFFVPSAQTWVLPHVQKLGFAPCVHHFVAQQQSEFFCPRFLDIWTMCTRLPSSKVTSTKKYPLKVENQHWHLRDDPVFFF